MVTLRQLSSVPLFATVIWLVWVYDSLFSLDSGLGRDHVARLMLCFLVLAISGWTLAKWPAKKGSTIAAILLAIIAIAIPLTVSKQDALKWEPYLLAGFDKARASGRPVFIDFTATWCLSCQVNEKLVLRAKDVEAQLASNDFIVTRADWTQYDDDHRATGFGRSRRCSNLRALSRGNQQEG